MGVKTFAIVTANICTIGQTHEANRTFKKFFENIGFER